MNPHTHSNESLVAHFIWRAFHIHRKVRATGQLQVRWYRGKLITFRYPAPHGYGVRGVLIAIYTPTAKRDWIEDDLLSFAQTLGETHSAIPA